MGEIMAKDVAKRGKPVAKARTIKVVDETWAQWQAQAKAEGLSVAGLILRRGKIATAHAAAVAEIAALKEALATAKAVRPAKPVRPTEAVSQGRPQVPEPKPPTDADREYRRKLLTGAINPKKERKAKP